MMPFAPLEPARLAGLAWTFPTQFGFARDRLAVPLVASELLRAAHDFPIVFMRSEDEWRAAAYLGDDHGRPGRFIDPNGRWQARYIPFWLRVFPFAVAGGQVRIVLDPHVVSVAGTHPFSAEGALSREATAVAKQLTSANLATESHAAFIRTLIEHAGAEAPFGAPGSGLLVLDTERFQTSVREKPALWAHQRQALELGIAAQFSAFNAPGAVPSVTLDDPQPVRRPQPEEARPLSSSPQRFETSTVPADLDWLDLGEKIDLG